MLCLRGGMLVFASIVKLWLLLAVIIGVVVCARDTELVWQHDEESVYRLNQEGKSDATVRFIDLSSLPAELASGEIVMAGEKPLSRISITTNSINEPYDVLTGAFHLGPSEVQQIFSVIDSNLKKVTAAASVTTVVRPVIRQVRGKSILNSGGLRVPTVFAPEYAGHKFQLLGVEAPPGTTLELRNMTIVMPDATFFSARNGQTNLHSSGLMDYFDLGPSARVCFVNSMFLLKSCEGFDNRAFHVYCCLKRNCLAYSQEAYSGLGNSQGEVEYLSCHPSEPENEVAPAPDSAVQGIVCSLLGTVCAMLVAVWMVL